MDLTVLVMDGENGALLAEELQKSSRIGVVYCADRPDAARVLAKGADLLILDPFLPGLDCKAFLEQLIITGQRPGVITLSSFYTTEMLLDYSRLGVAFCMAKPVEFRSLLRCIEKWANGNGMRLGGKRIQLQKRISEILFDLGMSTLSGYYDCCKAVEWICGQKCVRGRITKELYPFIANATNQSTTQIERNIRYAIEKTWTFADPEVVERYFGNSIHSKRGRPSNAAFLCTIAEYLRTTGVLDEALG